MANPLEQITTVIFDFDNTLYDTERRKEFFWQMASVHGYNQVEAYRIYNEARLSEEKIIISLDRFLESLQSNIKKDKKTFLEDKVNDIIIEMEEGTNLLPGARELVEWCFDQHLDCYLLSLGVREWQEMKFQQSTLSAYFPPEKVVITDDFKHGKKDAIEQLFGGRFKGEKTVLINDKPDETRGLLMAFSGMRTLLRREIRDVRYRVKDFKNIEENFPGRAAWSESLITLQQLLSKMI